MTANKIQTITINTDELIQLLEPLMRRIVREELAQFAVSEPNVFHLEPGSPLYEDMIAIRQKAKAGTLRLLSYQEVFGNE
jgi:hypothetical protein